MSPAAVRHPGERRWETNLLAVTTLVITAFGVLNCYAAGSYKQKWADEASQQLSAVIVGGVLFLIASRVDYHIWRKFAKPFFYITVVALIPIAIVATLYPEKNAPAMLETIFPLHNGARRWIKLGFQIQVSEIARFTLAAYLAVCLSDMGLKLRKLREGFAPVMAMVLLVAVLVYAENSLSMAIVLGAIGAGIIFTAGGRIDHMLAVGALGAIAGWLHMTRDTGFRHRRFEEFLTPALQCSTTDQACESLIGVGNGGIFGVGFGSGTQKMGHLRFAYSDFIFSGIAEEWGLIGVIFVVALFAVFCWVGFRIARSARDPFGIYLASGITIAVGVTALMHMAVVLRMMPPTGLTLPFISAGRASLVLYLFSAGVLMSIGRGRGKPASAD